MRAVERFVLSLDLAYKRACPATIAKGGATVGEFCAAFLDSGRTLLREALDATSDEVEFEVDEFLPLDHHG